MFKALLFSALALAAREQGAHVHGDMKVAIALEGKSGRIEVHAPAQVIYGFEYAAKSAKDKKAKDQGMQKLADKISEMIVLDPESKCDIKMEMSEVDQKEAHADVEAEFRVNCEKSPAGTNVIINISKVFPRVKRVQVDLVGEGVQKSQEVKKSGESIEFK